jgi:hypothetical protein
MGPSLDARWQKDESLKDWETSGSLIQMALTAGDAFSWGGRQH